MALAQNLADFRAANVELLSHINFANHKYANGTFKIRCSEEGANKHTVKGGSTLEYW